MSGEYGLAKSLILAKHYHGKSLKGTEKFAGSKCQHFAYFFSMTLYQLGCRQYEGVVDIPGHSPIPKALFWLRRALEGGSLSWKDSVKESLSQMENKAKSHCVNCWKPEEFSSLKRCVRCSGAWYCGKECQVEHWQAGHKIDCIKKKSK